MPSYSCRLWLQKQKGGDADGKVAKYAERLISSLDNSKFGEWEALEKVDRHVRNNWIADGSAIIQGMQNAAELLGSKSKISQELLQRTASLEPKVAEQASLLISDMQELGYEPKSKPLGLLYYDALLESKQ